MKIFNIKNTWFLSLLAITSLASCTRDFTNIPSEDAIAIDNYYKTDEQVQTATDALYFKTWFNFHNSLYYDLEVGAGNMYAYTNDAIAMNQFNVTGNTGDVQIGWKSFWANISQSNFLINELESRVGPKVSKNVVDNTVGEAYFMRATSYFYLVRLWGAVPIIENNLDYINMPQVNTNKVDDVYTLIIRDYKKAIQLLNSKNRGSSNSSNIHVSKGSAKAMLAKVYLYKKDYANAKQLAEEVINSGEFKLLGGDILPTKSFGDLFTYAGNNNEESIFALQWPADGTYGSGNSANTLLGVSVSGVSTSNASYGAVFAPSQDVLTIYNSSDKRRKETFMLPGDVYPNVLAKYTSLNGNNTVTTYKPLTVPTGTLSQGSGSAIKKYCIGIASDDTGRIDGWGMMANSTYIMRYAELLLIHAESILAGGGTTSDAAALKSLNAVRNRAGLASITSFTFDDLFKERRRELAFEGDFWFDIRRLPTAQALALLSSQNRGDLWSGPKNYSADVNDLLLPYPDNEVAKNPKLLEAPVNYQFK